MTNLERKITWKQYEPDELDKQCTLVFKTLDTINISTQDKIELLEQCIDYLRMDIAYKEELKGL